MQPIKTILHPTDFSESSKYAMAYAISFTEEFQAKLVILHVIEEISSALYFDMLQAPPLTQLMLNIEKQAKQALDEVLPPELRGKLPTEYVLRKGIAFAAFCVVPQWRVIQHPEQVIRRRHHLRLLWRHGANTPN